MTVGKAATTMAIRQTCLVFSDNNIYFNTMELDVIKILRRNKRQFLRYNQFRKKLFAELAPKESEAIFYYLPLMLCTNHPNCPGYIPNQKRPFKVSGIDYAKSIRAALPRFKEVFSVTSGLSLKKLVSDCSIIEGIYTIGSVGTVSQTTQSDCDIWICVDRRGLNKKVWMQLNQKLNLIKDWFDHTYSMPIFFFLCDTDAIRENRFGSVDSESSGSAQKNVLKEEFYRTLILISGKVPLWWLCWHPDHSIQYQKVLGKISPERQAEYDLIDLGNLQQVPTEEYFGAVLWQLHKSLTSPMKSIVKMLLLKVLLEASRESLLCYRFRDQVMRGGAEGIFPDYSLFTLEAIFKHIEDEPKEEQLFLRECFYLRCEINPYKRNQPLKNFLSTQFFRRYPIEKTARNRLLRYTNWDLRDQVNLGNRLFKVLLRIYREISSSYDGVMSLSDQRDLTILGRKISASYLDKPGKIRVLKKPTGKLTILTLSIALEDKAWKIYSGNATDAPLFTSGNVLAVIGFLVWNNLFAPNQLRMRPNSSSVTHREIINIGTRIRDFFGIHEQLELPLGYFLQEEIITRALVVVGSVKNPWDTDYIRISMVYANSWGELFARDFLDAQAFEDFLQEMIDANQRVEVSFYVRRNCTSFDKIISRTRERLISNIPGSTPSDDPPGYCPPVFPEEAQ